MNLNIQNDIDTAIDFLKKHIPVKPYIGIILGSGLGKVAESISDSISIDYQDIPGFPKSTVEGHAGKLICGKIDGKDVFVLQGRFHFYEGYTMAQVTLPVRVMKNFGVEILVVTNAAGGLNQNFEPGDLMLITDHINLFGTNPLIGPNNHLWGPRFPDMGEAYNNSLQDLARKIAADKDILLREGVYAGLTGPTYETPAEVKFLSVIGADAVGMSTVPEVIIARHMGVNVLGISCITNVHRPKNNEKAHHAAVVEAAQQSSSKLIILLQSIIKEISIDDFAKG